MRPRVVLVTGVSRYLGGRLASVLQADPSIEKVIGVDTVPPRPDQVGDLGRTEFVRADIRNPLIAKVISSTGVDTVVHMNVIATPLGAGGRSAMKEINVIGTMQLLAACQKAPSMRRLVVKSTTAVYGSSSRDPALFTEDVEPRSLPRSGYGKDVVEVEGYVRGFGRRRPDVTLTLLRFTNFIGPTIDGALTRYFALPVCPSVLGFDPRIQLCHEDDGVEVLRRAAMEDHPGIFNVGGDGVMLLSQAARRAGRPTVPIPSPAVSLVAKAFRRAGLVDFSPEQMRYFEHGRVADVDRLKNVFGYTPRYTTVEAFEDYVRARELRKTIPPEAVEAVERSLLGLVARGARRELPSPSVEVHA
jgi:UDP-glucose 4-epimerase